MIINSKIKNTSDAIDYLNRAVFGEDPETSVLTRVYEGDAPIQDRVTAVENSAALVDVQALKDKVDELSELTEVFANLAYPMPNLVVNGDFSNGTTGWSTVNPSNMPLTVSNNILSFTATEQYGGAYFNFTSSINEEYYFSASVKTDSKLVGLYVRFTANIIVSDDSGFGTFAHISSLTTATSETVQSFRISDYRTSGWTETQVKNVNLFNVSTMKLKGIKNDDGVPFTLLTNEQIRTQLDLWVQTRFPLDVLLMMRS